MGELSLILAGLSLLIWLFLLCGWGGFWQCDQMLEQGGESEEKEERQAERGEKGREAGCLHLTSAPSHLTPDTSHPSVCAVIPARNEADLLPITLRSLLQQDYPGALTVILVDDHSTDGTAEVAQQTAAAIDNATQLQVMQAAPLPPGWSGKLWAMEQGVQKAQTFAPDYILLTDADIEHDPANLRRLVEKATQANLEMASVMVRLRCESGWEKLLIPAFVFFFQKLYPFRWVNNPRRKTAAAAGGCILIRQAALTRIGGIASIREALIDDCALAQRVKERGEGTEERGQETGELLHSIWLGLSDRTRSLRPYDTLATIWEMVARTAYTQLSYSSLLLVGTLVGMALVYLVAPVSLGVGLWRGDWWLAGLGFGVWLLMAIAYFPTIRFYRCSPIYAVYLPLIAWLYTLMTLDSARRHWQGKGGAWKGRVYAAK